MSFAKPFAAHFLTKRSWEKSSAASSSAPKLPIVKIAYPSSLWLVVGRAATSVLAVVALLSLSFWAGMQYQSKGMPRSLAPHPAQVSGAATKENAAVASLPPTWQDLSVEGLSVQGLTVIKLPDGRYAYEYSIANTGRRFVGDLEISVLGLSAQHAKTITLTPSANNASGDKAPQFSVGSFLKSGGVMVLPENFKPRSFFFRFHERPQTRASKIVNISPDLGD